MRLSPFNPIRFFGADEQSICGKDFVQVYCTSDIIMIELIHDHNETVPGLELYECATDELVSRLKWKPYKVNDDKICSIVELTGMEEGVFRFRIGSLESGPVRIRGDDETDGTVLLQYAYKDNRMREDVVSRFFGMLRYFEFRLQGGFKDNGWTFHVDNEQFLSQSSDPVELSATDYTDKVLTIGSSSGVPAWVAELVNIIFSCPAVFVDGERHTRAGDSSPEIAGSTDFEKNVYTMMLREANFIDPVLERRLRLTLRRAPGGLRGANNQFRKLR